MPTVSQRESSIPRSAVSVLNLEPEKHAAWQVYPPLKKLSRERAERSLVWLMRHPHSRHGCSRRAVESTAW